jgi:glycolate oxidase
VAGFETAQGATRAIRAIFAAGILPCALEIADKFTLAAARKYTGSKRLDGSNCLLFVELDGQETSVRNELQSLERTLRQQELAMLESAFGSAECEKLWQIRRDFSTSLRATGLIKLNEDIVVPRGRLEELFAFTEALQAKYGLPVACFGHSGDGNIHVNIMYDKSWPDVGQKTAAALDELFRQVLDWGGAITGEHGIGLAKKKWWSMAASPELCALHNTVKRALDPNGILNPGKFLE